MKKQLALVVVGLVAVLVLAAQLARATAGPSPSDIQDSLPAFSPTGADVAFERTAPGLQHVLDMTAGGRSTGVVAGNGVLRGWVPGTKNVLVQSGSETLLQHDNHRDPPLAVLHGVDATASPDGTRVAFLRGGTLYVSRIDELPPYVASVPSPPEQAVAGGIDPPSSDVTGPVWSPDSSRIAVASGSSLLLVNADGSGQRVLFGGAGHSVDPSWSHDGSTIAFENDGGPHWQIWTIAPDGTNAHELLGGPSSDYRYPVFAPVSGALAYISDRQHARGGATQYQYALYVRVPSGVARKLVDDVHPYSPAAWSPNAALVAVSAGQECRRWGIYVVRAAGGARATRRSNLCRFDGTSGNDRLRGSNSFDIMNGLGGDDVMDGLGGNDKILGENGNDRIAGGPGNDVIFGGPGNDRLYGGPGNDVIVGGPGRDVIDCGPGVDTVEAVQRIDVVSRNCEHVQH